MTVCLLVLQKLMGRDSTEKNMGELVCERAQSKSEL